MTKTTLRYHHDKNCPGRPVDKKALPVKRRIKNNNMFQNKQMYGNQLKYLEQVKKN